ncbi:MAG TPA: hypothetical protein VFL14_15980 [Xanthomonadales bacterium]|nr:hypothetical protein [Xanthomonadales bacterium]
MRTRLLVAALACCLSGIARADPPAPDLGGRTPLDLTGPTPAALSAGTLVATDDAAIAVADCADPAPGQLLWLPADDADAAKHERERIAATHGVARERDVLVLTPKDGQPLRFTDWAMPERADADGDFVRYRYAGTLEGSGWWRVEVQYGHDAPSSWLVNPASGHAVHVHNGGEVATLSQDGRWLATFDVNAAPFRLALVFLGEGAPTLAVDCLFAGKGRYAPIACGFRDARYEARWGKAGFALERTRDGWQLLGNAPGGECRAPR